MARSIVSQSEQYGLPEREAATLPPASEVSDLLAGPKIMPGLMKRNKSAARDVEDTMTKIGDYDGYGSGLSCPNNTGRIHDMSPEDKAAFDAKKQRMEEAWQERIRNDPSHPKSPNYRGAAQHSKDDLPWQEQAKPHYVFRQQGDPGYQPRDPEDIYAEDAARNGGYDWRDPGESSRHQNRTARFVVEADMQENYDPAFDENHGGNDRWRHVPGGAGNGLDQWVRSHPNENRSATVEQSADPNDPPWTWSHYDTDIGGPEGNGAEYPNAFGSVHTQEQAHAAADEALGHEDPSGMWADMAHHGWAPRDQGDPATYKGDPAFAPPPRPKRRRGAIT